MAGMGPPPKETKRRRNADTFSDVQAKVVEDGKRRGPDLPGQWPDYVNDWYEVWRTSAQAKTFVRTDWARLHMLAPLIADYLNRPTAMKMAEIRQNESLLGATHVDRLRARMKVELTDVEPTKDVPAGVTALNEYRNRLSASG